LEGKIRSAGGIFMSGSQQPKNYLHVLSLLALCPSRAAEVISYFAGLDSHGRNQLLALTDSHHVVLRALQPLGQAATRAGLAEIAQFAQGAINKERGRIENALKFLDAICREFECAGCPVAVIKTLDHWPDFGNDLDLYTPADRLHVTELLTRKFHACLLPRTVGDRLANKWSFRVPGLSQDLEVHIGRLGQAGEHVELANRFISRRQPKQVSGYTFQIPAPEERVFASTLQRMYRHLYFRVCDILNTATLIESRAVDYADLRDGADRGGIWAGVATFLVIVSNYLEQYRGAGLELPADVVSSALFGAEKLFARGRFLYFPVLPQGLALYTRQLARTLLRGDVPATARLSLLPPLASVAALAYGVAGSSERIW